MLLLLSVFKRLLLMLLVLAVLTGAFLGWLGTTNNGLRVLVGWGLPYAPGAVQIGEIRGTLLTGLSLRKVEYRQPEAEIQAEIQALEFAWQAAALWDKTVRVGVLRMDGVRLQMPAAPPQEPATTPPEGLPPISIPQIHLPLRVMLDEVQVTDFRFQQGQAAPFIIERIFLGAQADEQGVQVTRLEVDAPLFNLAGKIDFGFATPHVIAIENAWRVRTGGLPELSGTLAVHGDVQTFIIENQIQQPFPLQLHAVVEDLTGAPSWRGEVAWTDARWPLDTTPAQVSSSHGNIQAQGADWQHYQLDMSAQLGGSQIPAGDWHLVGHGDWETFSLTHLTAKILDGQLQAQAETAWQPVLQTAFTLHGENLNLQTWWAEWPQGMTLDTNLRAHFENNILHLEEMRLDTPQTGMRLQGSGRVETGDEQVQMEIDWNWKQLRWPLAGTAEVFSDSGSVHVTGTPHTYHVQLQADVQGPQIPAGKWNFSGSGSDHDLHIEGLRGKVLRGGLQLSGDVAWEPNVKWDIQMTGTDLDPGIQWPQLPGQLAVDVRSHGTYSADAAQSVVMLDIAQFDGQLRGYPLRTHGKIQGSGLNWQVDGLAVRSGSAELRVDGQVGEKMKLNLDLTAPDLSEVLPQLRGELRAKGTAQGTLQRPAIKLDAQGQGMGFDDLQLKQFKASINTDLNQDRLQADIQLQDLRQIEQVLLDNAQLTLHGQTAAHTLELAAKTPQGVINSQLQGAYDFQMWHGQIKTLRGQLAKFGSIALQWPAELNLGATQASLKRACLGYTPESGVTTPPQLCADANWQTGAGQATLSLNNWDLNLARPFLPQGTEVSGVMGGEIHAALSAEGALSADVALGLTPGELYAMLEGERHQFPHRGGDVRVQISPENGLQGQLVLNFLDSSGVRGSVHLPNLQHLPLAEEQPLQAALHLSFMDLGVITGFVPLLKHPTGQMILELAVGGHLSAPLLEKSALNLTASTEVPDLGLELREIRFVAHNQDSQTLALEGAVLSGEGDVGLRGQLKIPNFNDWALYLEAIGKNLQVADTPDVRARISPDLAVRVKPGNVAVRGKLMVPLLHLTPHISFTSQGSSIPGAVRTSSDVVIIDDSEQETTPQAATTWRHDAQIKLILGEDVHIDAEGFESRMGGSLLIMSKAGQVMPLGNGELQILDGTFRAYGQDLEIRRGQVNYADGPLYNPGLNIRAVRTIYHDTSTRKVERAGVHILGTAQKPEINLFSEPMTSDAEILSYIVTGGPLTGADPSKRTLSLGGYLSKNLYAGAGISLFNQSKMLNLRYDINSKWSLEAVLGEDESGVDFAYTIGR